jgi:glycosyltransferase involved in cell wall biosynthesis
MRASVVIAAHNEGDLLTRTVESCVRTTGGLDLEFVVADDGSTDGSIQALKRRFPFVRTVRHRRRRGCSATKDLGARKARGDVLVFLDGHCNPEPLAIERLINDVEDLSGRAVVTPAVPHLDTKHWKNVYSQVGFGYGMRLEELDCDWVAPEHMRPRGRFYESPSLCGCCLAVSRELYLKLWGFDPNMVEWGIEDLDLALKAWLLGGGIVSDPLACVGHRFRQTFDTFTVADIAIPVNQLRMARKHFSDRLWEEWIERFRAREGSIDWKRVWSRFQEGRRSVERERRYLLAHRERDEYWYAARFSLAWPPLQ